MIPRVSVRNRRTLSDTRDLISVIPPCHDSRVLGCVVSEPPIRLTIVINHDRSTISEFCLIHQGRIGHSLRHKDTVMKETVRVGEDEKDNHSCSHLCHDLTRRCLEIILHGSKQRLKCGRKSARSSIVHFFPASLVFLLVLFLLGHIALGSSSVLGLSLKCRKIQGCGNLFVTPLQHIRHCNTTQT